MKLKHRILVHRFLSGFDCLHDENIKRIEIQHPNTEMLYPQNRYLLFAYLVARIFTFLSRSCDQRQTLKM